MSRLESAMPLPGRVVLRLLTNMTDRSSGISLVLSLLALCGACRVADPAPDAPDAQAGGTTTGGTSTGGMPGTGGLSSGGDVGVGPFYPNAPPAPVPGPWTDPTLEPVLPPALGDDWHANDRAALAALETMYLPNGRFDTGWPWTFANAVEAVESSYVRSGGENQLHMIVGTFDKLNTEFLAEPGYDDQLWWAHTWIRAYDLTADSVYMDMAKTIFADTTNGWEPSVCGGGIWWQKREVYKNAITNELFLLVAAALHNRTVGDEGTGSYLEWATKTWKWFSESGMINEQGLINDGLHYEEETPDSCINNGQTTWTYNQGIILGGLLELYEATGDASLLTQAEVLADASTTQLVNEQGILVEPCGGECNYDQVSFKGLYLRNLLRLYDWTHKATYYDFLLKNARSVWHNARDESNRLGSHWSGPPDMAGSTPQSSGMFALSALADKRSGASLFLRPSGGPTFTHEVGQSADLLAWSCDAVTCPTPGLLQGGPFVSHLPPGTHRMKVSVEVDAVSAMTDSIATLEVFDTGSSQVIATRPLPWNEWLEAGVPRTFELEFTHLSDSPLEFRIQWSALPSPPRLVVRDTWIDGEHSFSGANLSHECGSLDSSFHWSVDRHRSATPCVMTRGPGVRLDAGDHVAHFELKIDNVALAETPVATVSVVNTEEDKTIAALPLTRRSFGTTMFHTFAVPFTAVEGYHYEFLVEWQAAADAPRLVQRGVHVRRATTETTVPLAFNAGDLLHPSNVGAARDVHFHPFVFATEGPNAVQGGAPDIAVTPGNYTSLELLDFAISGTQLNQEFTLLYQDGSSETVIRSVSDWLAASPQADERIAFGLAYRVKNGVTQYGNYHVFHHSLPVDPSKVLVAFRLPANPNVNLLAATLSSPR